VSADPSLEPAGTRAVPAPRRLTPKGAATRARILEHATEAFATEGYAATSIRTVAVRAGMTTGAIYASFGSKANLLLEAVRESIFVGLEEVPADILGRPLPDIVAWQFERSEEPARVRQRKLLIEAAVAATTDREIADALGNLVGARLDEWAEAHREWQRQAGADPAADMHALTALSMAIDLGMGILDQLRVTTPTPHQTAELVRGLMQSLVIPKTEPVRASGDAPDVPGGRGPSRG
jgi:AcrR family transcriptional regulator